ncbi:hypothetical protein ILUMI_01704, partial [Ignelater luminosus]
MDSAPPLEYGPEPVPADTYHCNPHTGTVHRTTGYMHLPVSPPHAIVTIDPSGHRRYSCPANTTILPPPSEVVFHHLTTTQPTTSQPTASQPATSRQPTSRNNQRKRQAAPREDTPPNPDEPISPSRTIVPEHAAPPPADDFQTITRPKSKRSKP